FHHALLFRNLVEPANRFQIHQRVGLDQSLLDHAQQIAAAAYCDGVGLLAEQLHGLREAPRIHIRKCFHAGTFARNLGRFYRTPRKASNAEHAELYFLGGSWSPPDDPTNSFLPSGKVMSRPLALLLPSFARYPSTTTTVPSSSVVRVKPRRNSVFG